MRSEGVGKMQLYAPSGELFPGFDKVVFAKNASEKLASVGELCDAGLVCVFDKHGLRTYSASDCNVTGKIFSQDVRDKKSRLYPLTLFREKTQQVDVDVHAALLDASDTGPMERVYPVTVAPDLNLPVSFLMVINHRHCCWRTRISKKESLRWIGCMLSVATLVSSISREHFLISKCRKSIDVSFALKANTQIFSLYMCP